MRRPALPAAMLAVKMPTFARAAETWAEIAGLGAIAATVPRFPAGRVRPTHTPESHSGIGEGEKWHDEMLDPGREGVLETQPRPEPEDDVDERVPGADPIHHDQCDHDIPAIVRLSASLALLKKFGKRERAANSAAFGP